MQLFLERRELNNARYIVPNSRIIKQQLAHYYPEFAHKLAEPVLPGVNASIPREDRTVAGDGGVVGFVGTEWKRKGLPLAVAAVEQLRRSRPNLQFIVVGPKAADIQHLFADWQGGYVLKEWTDQVPFAEFDVLFHPAKFEPYGMVISEAMAAKVPVVFSDACGAEMNTTTDAGVVLAINSPLQDWVDALERQLSRTAPVPQFQRGWNEVAREYESGWRFFEQRAKYVAHETVRPLDWLHAH